MATVSGSNLNAWSAAADHCFDPDDEFTADAVGHTIEISGGTGFVAGRYAISGFIAAVNMGGQGVHDVVTVVLWDGDSQEPPCVLPASGAAWSYNVGVEGAGFSGSNLTPWDRAQEYLYDPDAPVSSELNGTSITISGTGFNAGTYNVIGFIGNFATGDHGPQNLIQVSQTAGQYPASIYTDGGVWAKSGGDTIPTPTVNTDFTGAIKVMLIGDSITQQMAGGTATALDTQYPNAASVSVLNRGESGTTSASWVSGSLIDDAITAANVAGVTVVSIMLGTNDSKTSVATTAIDHKANIQAICDKLHAEIPTLTSIVLHEHPYIIPGSFGEWDATSNTLIQAYFSTYSTVTGATQGITGADANYEFFERNPALSADGVHPTSAGNAEINYTWLTGLEDAIAGSPPAPSGSVMGDHITLGLHLGL